MDVLKDSSAAAIYGTRGTNGVIIITKRGANFSDSQQLKLNILVTPQVLFAMVIWAWPPANSVI
ncbi:MAG: hypothetical protein H6543_03055 [Prevotellaceae bacterium]|nr:hypothetical protein [Prevotellaceae bacterium]